MPINKLGNGNGGALSVKVSATNYTDLITNYPATNYKISDKASIEFGEQEFTSSKVIFWTEPKYKYPAGLWIVRNDIDTDPANNYWDIWQTQTINSLKTVILDITTDWTSFFNSSPTVESGALINYLDIVYRNDTGNITATPPIQDALNWDIEDKNIIRYYNDLGFDIDPFIVLHAKNTINIAGKEHLTPDIADASKWEFTQGTLSVTCETILDGTFGCTVVGSFRLKGGDTSFLPAPSQNWLSADGSGKLTNIRPEFPNFAISMGANLNSLPAPNGEMFVNQTTDIYDIFNSGWDGAIKESFDFRVVSDGVNITGTLTNQQFPLNDLTLLFSDGFSTLDVTTVPLTVVIPEGTATTPLLSYVFIDKATKTLQTNTSGFPSNEHSKIAIIVVLDTLTTQTDGALRNQNFNDHIKTYDNNGHILHMAERLRKLNASWSSGIAPTLTGLTTDLYIATTSGIVDQLHPQVIPAQDMALGDECHVVNDPVTPYRSTSNLNDITVYSTGLTWNNEWSNIVVWGIANKSGEAYHLMVNLPSDGYNSEENAVADRNNYSNYTIPQEFQGVGFLIGRFTIRRSGTVFTYNSGVGFLDLRGSVPNNTVGGGTGSSGITDWTQLTDTPSSYVGQAGKNPTVNSGETGLEFILNTLQVMYNNFSTGFHIVLSNIKGAFSLKQESGYSGNYLECRDSAGDLRVYIGNDGRLIIGNGGDIQEGIHINQPAGGGAITGLLIDASVSGGAKAVNIRYGQDNANPIFYIDDNRIAVLDRYLQQEGVDGEMLVENGSSNQPIPTGTTNTKITAFNTAGLFANTSIDFLNNEITIFVTGRYKILATVTFEALDVGVLWHFSAVKNITEEIVEEEFLSTGNEGKVVLTKNVDVATNDDLDLRVRHDQAGTLNIKILKCVYSVIYLGTTRTI